MPPPNCARPEAGEGDLHTKIYKDDMVEATEPYPLQDYIFMRTSFVEPFRQESIPIERSYFIKYTNGLQLDLKCCHMLNLHLPFWPSFSSIWLLFFHFNQCCYQFCKHFLVSLSANKERKGPLFTLGNRFSSKLVFNLAEHQTLL